MRPDEDSVPMVPLARLRAAQHYAQVAIIERNEARAQMRDLELQRDRLARALADIRALTGDPPAWYGAIADDALSYLALTPAERAQDAEEQSGAQAMQDETAYSRYGG